MGKKHDRSSLVPNCGAGGASRRKGTDWSVSTTHDSVPGQSRQFDAKVSEVSRHRGRLSGLLSFGAWETALRLHWLRHVPAPELSESSLSPEPHIYASMGSGTARLKRRLDKQGIKLREQDSREEYLPGAFVRCHKTSVQINSPTRVLVVSRSALHCLPWRKRMPMNLFLYGSKKYRPIALLA